MKNYIIFIEDAVNLGNVKLKSMHNTEEEAKTFLEKVALDLVRNDGGERQAKLCKLGDKTLEQLASESAKTAPVGLYIREDEENKLIYVYEKFVQIGWVRTTAQAELRNIIGYTDIDTEFKNSSNFDYSINNSFGIPKPPIPPSINFGKKETKINTDQEGPSMAFLGQLKEMFENHDKDDPSFKLDNLDVVKHRVKKNTNSKTKWKYDGNKWIKVCDESQINENDVISLPKIEKKISEEDNNTVKNVSGVNITPTKNDDITKGFTFGSKWKTLNESYFCITSEEGNADWFKYEEDSNNIMPQIPLLPEVMIDTTNEEISTLQDLPKMMGELNEEIYCDQVTTPVSLSKDNNANRCKDNWEMWLDEMEKNMTSFEDWDGKTVPEVVEYDRYGSDIASSSSEVTLSDSESSIFTSDSSLSDTVSTHTYSSSGLSTDNDSFSDDMSYVKFNNNSIQVQSLVDSLNLEKNDLYYYDKDKDNYFEALNLELISGRTFRNK